MKWFYLLYGILVGLLPFAIGITAAEIDPHGAAAQLPWLTMVTLPAGTVLGLVAAVFL
jgi:hypothetical protein